MLPPWLTDDELHELTGYVRPSFQERWLNEQGIKCHRNALNKIRVPRDAIAVHRASVAEKRTEPDFTKVRRAG